MDFNGYFSGLYKGLVTAGFEPVTEVCEDGFAGFVNNDNVVWHCFFVINENLTDFEKFKTASLEWSKYLYKLKAHYDIQKIINISLFVGGESMDQGYERLMNSGYFEHDGGIINVYWRFDLHGGTFTAAKNNPDKVLKLREIVTDISGFGFDADTGAERNGAELRASGGINDSYAKAVSERPRLRVKSEMPYAGYAMIIINMFVACVITMRYSGWAFQEIILAGAIITENIYAGEIYRLFTAMFMHTGVIHLASNVLGIYIFGLRAEKYLGSLKFLILYLLSGLAAGVFSLLFTDGASVGASGAVCGAVGCILAMILKSKTRISGMNLQFIAAYMAAVLGLGALRSDIDNFAHLGGFLAGALIGYAIYKPEMENGDSGER